MLYQPSMMDRYLGYCGVKLQDFKTFAESTTARVKAAAYRAAALAGRPLEYLRSPQLCKEELAREVARRDKIKVGLIAIFSATDEPASSQPLPLLTLLSSVQSLRCGLLLPTVHIPLNCRSRYREHPFDSI
jgi:hypothetical protein